MEKADKKIGDLEIRKKYGKKMGKIWERSGKNIGFTNEKIWKNREKNIGITKKRWKKYEEHMARYGKNIGEIWKNIGITRHCYLNHGITDNI